MQKNNNEFAYPLAFQLHEMLGVPETTPLKVEVLSGPTTALTLNVCALGDINRSFFVKTLRKGTPHGSHLNLGLREVRFYDLMESLSPDPYPNIPRCINRFVSEDQGNYCLVLEDLSNTHISHRAMNFEDLRPWKAALAALAYFHRHFTQRLSKQQIRELADDYDDVERYIIKLTQAFEKFQSDHEDILDDSIFLLMKRSIPLIRAFELEKVDRTYQNELTTLLHRDAHLRNFLYPRSEDGHAVIVDWQFWGLGMGIFDLRHLLGSAMGPELRPHQRSLVRYYFECYTDGLQTDYSWTDCWEDYRKGVIDNLFMPVWQYTGFGWPYERWCDTLQAALENYAALDCDQVLI